ncbi:MAG: DUF2062 domain-containing protein [Acidobacteria bacterium]|nr:DUF2062 domain-containing protein [Acidobacteriota bacterium]
MNTSNQRPQNTHRHAPERHCRRRQSILTVVHNKQLSSREDIQADTGVHHNWLYRRIALPILALLRMGATPQRLAWSIAVGVVIGINPLLGSTTVLCLAVAAIFRLNIAASQVGNHIVYPLELLLFVPFLQLGSMVFHTAGLPLAPSAILEAARRHPIDLVREIWRWEWHALVVWAAIAVVVAPVIAVALTPLLRRLLTRVERRQYPILH